MRIWPFCKRESLDAVFMRFTEHFVKKILPELDKNTSLLRGNNDALLKISSSFEALTAELMKERVRREKEEEEERLAKPYDEKY